MDEASSPIEVSESHSLFTKDPEETKRSKEDLIRIAKKQVPDPADYSLSKGSLPINPSERQLLDTITTTSIISEFSSEGSNYVLKEIGKNSRLLEGGPQYSAENREEYLDYLVKRASYLREYQEVVEEIFGDSVVKMDYVIAENHEGIPTIMAIQEKVEGERAVFVESGVSIDYEGRGKRPYRKLDESDPRREKVLSGLKKITDIVEQVKNGQYSQESEKIKRFEEKHPNYLKYQIDVHRLGNVLMEENGDLKIIDW